jgi:hypothetical protein
MNKLVSKLYATVIIMAMLVGTIAAVQATPPAPPAIWIMPEFLNFDTGSTSVGDTFSVTAWISTTVVTYAWQVKLYFNTAHLAAVSGSVVYTNGAKSQWFTGLSTTPVDAVIDNVTGFILFGESLSGAISRAPGSDSLFTATFKILAAPPVGGSLMSFIDPANADTYILDPDLGEIFEADGNSTYTFSWIPPTTKPYLAVSPDRTFDQFSHWTGTVFTEDLMIKNVESGWYLSDVTTKMTYNNTLTSVTGVVFDPIWTTASWSEPTPGDLLFTVNTAATPSGDVAIATITFTILNQGNSPPMPFWPDVGSYDNSVLHCHAYTVSGNGGTLPITMNPATDATVTVRCFQELVPPHLEVSSVTMGPGPALGEEFNVTVSLVGVHFALNVIGVQFRLTFDPALIYPTAIYEGPFLNDTAKLQPGSLGTWFYGVEDVPDGPWGPHVLIGNLIYPNATGSWNPPSLEGSGVVAIITFKVMYQSFGDADLHCDMNILDDLMIGLDNYEAQNIVEKPLLPPVNGLYTISTDLPGRQIDLFGGAVNSGYGAPKCNPFPAPYGGQGPNQPMDLVEEQSWVCLHANVTYNYWPVQHKLVGFQINYPDGSLYANLFAFTGEFGEAVVEFRMPWPCENPESLFGVWHVIAGVQVADIYMNDTMDFHYDYLVQIFKVTTDKYEYNHGEIVEVCVTFGSHAQQDYPILLKVHIADELGVIFGHFEIATTVGGAVYCQYKNSTLCGGIWIPKWAYAGIATVHVNIFDQEPIFGGAPWTPEYAPLPTIAIQPY